MSSFLGTMSSVVFTGAQTNPIIIGFGPNLIFVTKSTNDEEKLFVIITVKKQCVARTLMTSADTDLTVASSFLICSSLSSNIFSCFLRCSLEFSISSFVRVITFTREKRRKEKNFQVWE